MSTITHTITRLPAHGGMELRIIETRDDTGELTHVLIGRCSASAQEWPLPTSCVSVDANDLPALARALGAIVEGL